jgi:hypothetical protein
MASQTNYKLRPSQKTMSRSLIRSILPGALTLFLVACSAALPTPVNPIPTEKPSSIPLANPTQTPEATFTQQPTPTRRQYAIPTREPIVWQLPVYQFNWDSPDVIGFARWVGERTFSFESYEGQINTVSLNDQGKMTLGEPQQVNQPRSYSPHQKYLAECSSSEFSLYRLPEGNLLGKASLVVPDVVNFLTCNQYIQWSANDSAMIFSVYSGEPAEGHSEQSIYLWNTGQSQPQRLITVSSNFKSSVSPDFKYILYLPNEETPANNRLTADLAADIFDIESKTVTHVHLVRISWPAYPGWLTNDVFTIHFDRNITRYYDRKTGQYLFDFFNAMNCCGFHQPPALSPNQRWVTLDHNGSYLDKRYSLYDMQTKSEILLSESSMSRLSFSGWKPDSSLLYIVNSTNQPFAANDSYLDAGLLAYDPLTRTAKVLVADAVRAFWSPDMRFAWVIRQTINSQLVHASLYEAASSKLSGEFFVSPTPIKGDPGGDFLNLDFKMVWSHNSTRTLLANGLNELFLLADGKAKLLATGSYQTFSWSPDDHYALVYSSHSVWVVDLSRVF